MNRAGRPHAERYWAQSKVIQVWDGKFLATPTSLSLQNAELFNSDDLRIYLGEISGTHYFAVNKEFSDGHSLRELVANLDENLLELAVTSLAIANWHEAHPKCARCGADTEVIDQGWIRKCPVDQSQHFPRTDPAIIVAVQDRNGRICLGHQAAWPENRYSNFAGFVEPGESLESAVIREVAEESGLQVSEIKYLSSQPWPFPNSIMLAFEAFTDSPESAEPDGVEIQSLRWFTRNELKDAIASGAIAVPPITSVSGKMIDGWLNG
ncbi:MAG: NAD(+) diphosphatase [Candidatus Nanopelagicaceae bacterium]